MKLFRRTLPAAAVELLTAIRDHLNIPLYAEGDEIARQAWADLQALRVADVVAALDDPHGTTTETAANITAALRAYRAETAADYEVDTTPRSAL